MAFLSLLDERAKPKGSRDPLGFELVWSHFGRMVIGNLTMPAVLVGAAVWEPLKFLLAVPAFAITTAVAVAALSAFRQAEGDWK